MTRRPAQSYKQHPVTGEYDALVIGSGIGGLTAAALLAKHGGKRVLVLERHYTPGGYTHVFHRPGYEWDVGLHYVGGLEPGSAVRRIVDDIGEGRIQWADMGEVYDRVIIDGDAYDLPRGRRNLRAMLLQRFPAEQDAIDGYFAAVRAAVSASMPFQVAKVLPGPVAALAGPLLRRDFRRWAGRTTRQVLEELTDDRRLIAVLTAQLGDYGLPPGQSSFAMHALVASHYFRGGYYPVGGSGVIAEAIIPVIESAGGLVLTNAEVAQVVIERGRAVGVRMAADGAVLRARTVISDAGVWNTFGRLVPEADAQRAGLRAALDHVTPSIGHVCLYLGFEATAEELGLPRHNLWIYPSEDHDASFAEGTADPDAPLPLAYVSFPSAKDPDFTRRHPGRATVEVITAAPYSWFQRWEGSRWKHRDPQYDAFKERLAERMLAALYAQLPQLRGRVAVQEISTPLTTQHFAGYQHGELYGLEHSPARFAARFLTPATGIPGLYLTGQDIVSCGIAGAMFGGVLTATAVLRGRLLAQMATAAGAQVLRAPLARARAGGGRQRPAQARGADSAFGRPAR